MFTSIISIIIGAVFGLLVGSGIITVTTPLAFYLIFLLSIFFLVLLFSLLQRGMECRCYKVVKALTFGILLSIVLSLLGLIVIVELSAFLVGLYSFLVGTAFLFEIFCLYELTICVAGRIFRD